MTNSGGVVMERGVRNQYIVATAACLSALTSATCYSWITPLLPWLLSPSSELPLTIVDLPWVISVIELGCLLSPLPAALLINHVGRKIVLLSSAPLFMLSWTIVLGYPCVTGLSVARFIQGLSIGLVLTVAPVYLAEVSSPQSKGVITKMFGTVWWGGVLLGYVLGPLTSFTTFTYFTMFLNIPFCLALMWIPETPAFYLLVGDEERATRSLIWFRDGSSDAIKREVESIKANLEINKRSSSFREVLATSVDRQGLTIMMVVVAVRALSGHSVLVVYATHIFSQVPIHSWSPDTFTVILGVFMFAGHLIGMVLSENIGRRPLLLFSCLISLICHLVTASYFFLLSHQAVDVSALSWLPPLAINIYSMVHCSCMSPVSVAYTSELFRAPVRSVAARLSTLTLTLLSFVLMSIYEPMITDAGMYANFYTFAFVCLIGCVYFYLFAPETQGKSFFQIRKELCGISTDSRPSEIEPLFVDDVDFDPL